MKLSNEPKFTVPIAQYNKSSSSPAISASRSREPSPRRDDRRRDDRRDRSRDRSSRDRSRDRSRRSRSRSRDRYSSRRRHRSRSRTLSPPPRKSASRIPVNSEAEDALFDSIFDTRVYCSLVDTLRKEHGTSGRRGDDFPLKKLNADLDCMILSYGVEK